MLLSLNLKYTRECFKLALPVMLTQLGQVSVNLFDNMMVGNMLGANALASTALANSVFISVFIFGVGVSFAIPPLVSEAQAQKDHDRINSVFRHGAVINTIIGTILTFILLAIAPFLHYAKQPEEMLKAARECKIAILTSRTATSRLSGELSSYLDSRLAERTSVHGVLMDIYGMGVLIQGDSGIGKSETGLELVKRGHRLVADDRVDIFAKDEITLWGEPAEILKHLIEIRGVGIIDVMSLYGASAVKDSSQVQLAVYLENYDTHKTFDRLGNNAEEIEISGVGIPRIRIPVKTGRNISVVIEAAAMNYRAKEMGFDATGLFEERLTNLIAQNEVPNA